MTRLSVVGRRRHAAYDFPMLVQILDRSISKDDLAPMHWYVSAND